MREARAAGRIWHPNIVIIHDAATDPDSQSSYIVMKNGNVTLEGYVTSRIEKSKADANPRFAATYFGFTNNLQVESGEGQWM